MRTNVFNMTKKRRHKANASILTEMQSEEKVFSPSQDEGQHSSSNTVCRCGCVPNQLMSLFEMAEMRARLRAKKLAQNLPTTQNVDRNDLK